MTSAQHVPHTLSLALVGSGGAGVMTAGNLLLEAAAKAGHFGLMTRSVGPQIRGGEAAALLRMGERVIACLDDTVDALVAIDWKNAQRFAAEIPLTPAGLIVADPGAGAIPEAIGSSGARLVPIPLAEIAARVPGGRANMVALGVASALAGFDEPALRAVLGTHLGAKGEEVVAAGMAAVEAGMAAARDAGVARPPSPQRTERARWLISGNQATGLGALRGGVRFVAAYPITPATEVLEWLAANIERVGGSLLQAEDELASINMAIGASWSGIPALTATSGPGLSLMMEGLGLAVGAEVPLVVVDVMRGGPSTGIPTKSEQADLNIAVHGFHGDAPHLVVAPTSVSDCVFTTQWAVHLAEALQAPAIVLSDQFMGQASAVIDAPAPVSFVARRAVASEPAAGFRRYAVTADGVSPMSLPGTPLGQYTADGLAHDPGGTPSTRMDDHAAQLDKRARKIEAFDYGTHWADVEGDAPLAVLTWGSTTGAVREAIARLRSEGRAVRLIALRLLAPARPQQMTEALAGVEHLLVVEQSHSRQFHRLLRAHYDLPAATRVLHRPGPLTFRPGEIADALRAWSQT